MKFYAIKKGKKPGIYTNWPEAKAQVTGFSGAVYKGFTSQAEAEEFMNSGMKEVKVSKDAIVVYTDGGSRNTGNVKGGHVNSHDKAAWAYVILDHGKQVGDSAGEYGVTNNKMEITAFIKALEKLQALSKQNEEISLISDSKYVINAITLGWLQGWKKRGWKKADGQEPANKELWVQLDKLLADFNKLQITWTKGHAENAGNNLVDEMLNMTMDKM
ncbi:ribonuclease H [Companilactobacillus sp. RD055328]|uniref:ribonuclease H family protein n=1 Tax=Companilactobacillus sp. RD055328 TaxID=2916634 RepID=UPI001FC8070A|nr:ribonuclease H family protein [Companilactobacillus sp. RD055328]GKQ43267.1 ribonuclease H [Companilactobacillus sp. RD055328]